MITDKQIQKTIREACANGKDAIELKDGGERGSGRLAILGEVGATGLRCRRPQIFFEPGSAHSSSRSPRVRRPLRSRQTSRR